MYKLSIKSKKAVSDKDLFAFDPDIIRDAVSRNDLINLKNAKSGLNQAYRKVLKGITSYGGYRDIEGEEAFQEAYIDAQEKYNVSNKRQDVEVAEQAVLDALYSFAKTNGKGLISENWQKYFRLNTPDSEYRQPLLRLICKAVGVKFVELVEV